MTITNDQEPAAVVVKESPARVVGVRDAIGRVAWTIALIVMAFYASDTVRVFDVQTTAPQQAVVGVWGCFRILTVYALARGFHELVRP